MDGLNGILPDMDMERPRFNPDEDGDRPSRLDAENDWDWGICNPLGLIWLLCSSWLLEFSVSCSWS